MKKNDVESFIDLKKSTFFHSTFDEFEIFDFSKSVFGMHFGTQESAENRLPIKKGECELNNFPLPHQGENPFLISAKIDLKNPLKLGENRTGGWRPHDVVRAIFEIAEKEGIEGFNEQDIEDFYNDEISLNGINLVDLIDEDYGDEYNNAELKEHLFIRDWIESKGYDSIVYKNEYEEGGESIIVFRESQIEILENKALNVDFKNKSNEKVNNELTEEQKVNLEIFTKSYIETSVWYSVDGEEILDGMELSSEAKEYMENSCKDFFINGGEKEINNTTPKLLDGIDKWKLAGHHFLLTQNGHGAGFWDGDWENGDKLTDMVKRFKNIDLYVCDDGELTCSMPDIDPVEKKDLSKRKSPKI
jgi:hypothetical protein